jgi:hypothetical protein
MVQWHGEEVHIESVAIRSEEFVKLFDKIDSSSLRDQFNSLSTNRELYSI